MRTAITRRRLGGILAAAGIGMVVGQESIAQEASPVATPLSSGPGGIDGVAGGGVLSRNGVDVPFSLMAFSAPGPDGELVTGGFLQLVDSATPDQALRIDAKEIVSVGPLSAQSTAGRQVIGFGTLNGSGRYPFVLQIEDLGGPGSGEDTFNLVFGEAAVPFLGGEDKAGCDCGGLGYSLRSNVVQGDLSLLGIAE